MQDPVTEVLDERAALSEGLAWSVLASALLHALVIGGGLIAARMHPASAPVPIISIHFSRVAGPLPARRAVAAPPAAPVQKPAATSVPLIKEPVAPVKPAVETPKPSSKTVPFSPFGKSTRKGSETSAPPPPPPAPLAGSAPDAGALPAVGSAGVAGLEGEDFPYSIYIDRMRALVGAKWYRPQVKQDLLTRVYFVINRDGSIRDAKIESESGNGTFDRAALRAILEVSPLPPLPFGYSGTYLGVHLVFH
jgi:TonB family protein